MNGGWIVVGCDWGGAGGGVERFFFFFFSPEKLDLECVWLSL